MKSAGLRKVLSGVLVVGLCVLSGCFEWTEDSQGNLKSAGLPGLPIWQSKAPPAPMKPTDLGFTREQASKMGGEVLVMPTANSGAMRYQFYQIGQNHCQDDLKKMLADRAQQNATDPAPYCTENPTQPSMKGNAFAF
jgi:hypothetical protein